jgi:putative peptidoglycan lipid II flippase
MLNAGAALLLGAASVAGNGVPGGVVAYQVAFVFFLAPYAVLAQPLHTAMLPELSMDAAAGSVDTLAGSIRWTLDRMALLVIPVSAAMVVFALPAMRLVSFGSASKTGPALLAAGVASLARGLFPYSALLLHARSDYALGDSRTPAIVGIASAVVGVLTMVVGSRIAEGAALVAWLGIGHSLAYAIGAVVLGIGCTRKIRRSFVPVLLPIATVIGGVIAVGAWLVMRALDPQGRAATVACLVLVGGVATAAYALAVRRWWRTPDLTPAGA